MNFGLSLRKRITFFVSQQYVHALSPIWKIRFSVESGLIRRARILSHLKTHSARVNSDRKCIETTRRAAIFKN